MLLCICDHQVGSMITFKNLAELAETMKVHMQFFYDIKAVRGAVTLQRK